MNILDFVMDLLFSSSSNDKFYKAVTTVNDYTLTLKTRKNREKAVSIDIWLEKTTEAHSWEVYFSQSARLKNVTVNVKYNDFNDENLNFYSDFESSLSSQLIELIGLKSDHEEEVRQIYAEALTAAGDILKNQIDSNYSVYNLLQSQKNGFTNYSIWYFVLFGFLILFPSLCLLLIFLFIKMLLVDSKKDHYVLVEDIIQTPGAPLPKNCKLTPIFKERVLRIVGIVVLLVTSLAPFIDFIISEEFLPIASKITSLRSIIGYAYSGLSISVLLLFFIKLDISIKKKNLQNMILMYFFFGIVFYYMTIVTTIHLNIHKIESIIDVIEHFLPGNIFFGLCAYSIIAYFLFQTPKGIADKPLQRKLFRMLSLIPILYLVFSNFALPFIKMPTRYYLLFYPKTLVTSCFAVSYLLGIYFLRVGICRKYKNNAKVYFNGKRYFMAKNIIAVAAIIVLSAIDIIFKNTSVGKVYFSGKFYLMCLRIPIILLYQPRMEKRNQKEDMIYGCSYALAFGSSYICYLIYFIIVMKSEILDFITFYIWLLSSR